MAVVVVIILGLTLVVNFVQVSWTSHFSSGLAGRTPATLAQECDDIGGTLTEDGAGEHPTCTAEGGNTIRCDWAEERCHVACDDAVTIGDAVRLLSEGRGHPACDEVRFLAAEPYRPLAAGTPVLGELSSRAGQ